MLFYLSVLVQLLVTVGLAVALVRGRPVPVTADDTDTG